MPYGFKFDLSRISKSFFRELARVAQESKIHKRMGNKARGLAERFKVAEITGLEVSKALQLVEDLVEVYILNISEKENFEKTRHRTLFLPHCSRKYMDVKCRAIFDPVVPSYKCQHCSEDCLISQATKLGENKNYDTYVLPGGSCVAKILRNNKYDGVVGVACSNELKLGENVLENMGITAQYVPLINNGCANTRFNLQNLENTL